MNYCALDEALSYIENGIISEEFIMADMIRSVNAINESIELITEEESFIEKVKNAIKRVLEAIGKFFSTIWKKFSTWFTKAISKAKELVATKYVEVKINSNKEYKNFMYNDKKYEMPVDFYKTIDVILSSYAAPNKNIENPEEYIKGNLTHKTVAAAECMQLYQLFEIDMERVNLNLNKITKDLEKSKKELNETIKKLDKISKMSKEDSKAAFDKMMGDKNAHLDFDDYQPGVTSPSLAKTELAIKKDELKKVNNCLKCSTVVIKVMMDEFNKINKFYPQLVEKAKKILEK